MFNTWPPKHHAVHFSLFLVPPLAIRTPGYIFMLASTRMVRITLMFSIAAFAAVTLAADASYAGRVRRQQDPNPAACFEANVNYNGNDVGTGPGHAGSFSTATASACQKLCQQTSACNFWTWYRSIGLEKFLIVKVDHLLINFVYKFNTLFNCRSTLLT